LGAAFLAHTITLRRTERFRRRPSTTRIFTPPKSQDDAAKQCVLRRR
jgi:hypothetical protein